MSGPTENRGSGANQNRPDETASFEARLSQIDGKLGKIKAQRDTERSAASSRAGGRGMANGMRMATEFVAAIIVGGLIGWVLDGWIGTKPWLFLGFFLFGCAAGVLNLIRGYERMRKEIAAETGGKIGHRVPDDED